MAILEGLIPAIENGVSVDTALDACSTTGWGVVWGISINWATEWFDVRSENHQSASTDLIDCCSTIEKMARAIKNLAKYWVMMKFDYDCDDEDGNGG